MSLFAERLLELKEVYNLNNVDIQKLTGCSNQSISKWINENVCPKLMSLIKLSDKFDCSIDFLLGLTDKKERVRKEKPLAFWQRLNQQLTSKNVTQYKVAKDCRFDKSNFTKWKRYALIPDTVTVIKMAQYFGVTVEYLYGLSDI